MLDFRIQTFLTVCQTMNFTRAAQLLHITQPAVSQHIRALEEQYAARLFRYEGRQLTLTPAGKLFYQAAATMHHDARRLRESIRQLADRQVLCFGATLTIGQYVIPGPLTRLLERESGLRLRMVVDNTAQLLDLLDRGEIDFALVEGFFPKRAYDSLVYRREPYLAVCAPDYRCARAIDRLDDLTGERLLIREPGSGTREVLERTLEEHNLTLDDFDRLVELGSLEAIKTLARQGAGVAFLYRAAAERELAEGTLRELSVPGLPICHDFSFLWRKGSVFAPYYRKIFRQLQLDASPALPENSLWENDCNSRSPVLK